MFECNESQANTYTSTYINIDIIQWRIVKQIPTDRKKHIRSVMHIMKIKLILSVHISVKQKQRWVFQFNFFFYFLDFVTLLSVKYNISSLFATSSRNPNGFKCIGVYLHSHICIEFMWVPPVWLSFNRVHCLWYPYPFQSFLVAASSVVFWCELARRFQQNQALVF